jgi:putative endonuclease
MQEGPEELCDEGTRRMTYFAYILECTDGSLYVGCTNNLKKRLAEHNSSKRGAHYTKIRRPVVLKYSEPFDTLLKARRREQEIKSWRREKKLDLIKNYPVS